mmetsp:Transcript_55928/g.111131  ORF Transcript_55928/g.111131 Transcript_55928/m.111131 type:complete len:325 (-) Transcript_55928:350-1324(-)
MARVPEAAVVKPGHVWFAARSSLEDPLLGLVLAPKESIRPSILVRLALSPAMCGCERSRRAKQIPDLFISFGGKSGLPRHRTGSSESPGPGPPPTHLSAVTGATWAAPSKMVSCSQSATPSLLSTSAGASVPCALRLPGPAAPLSLVRWHLPPPELEVIPEADAPPPSESPVELEPRMPLVPPDGCWWVRVGGVMVVGGCWCMVVVVGGCWLLLLVVGGWWSYPLLSVPATEVSWMTAPGLPAPFAPSSPPLCPSSEPPIPSLHFVSFRSALLSFRLVRSSSCLRRSISTRWLLSLPPSCPAPTGTEGPTPPSIPLGTTAACGG